MNEIQKYHRFSATYLIFSRLNMVFFSFSIILVVL
jgi:hypothetical protein